MGYYIDVARSGKVLPAKHKAEVLISEGAELIEGEIKFQPNLVCVVVNTVFDAAGFAYSEEEMNAFLYDRSMRHKTWLVVEDAAKLSGYKG